jgi:hypothetical protein
MRILQRLAGTRLTTSDVLFLLAKIVLLATLITWYGWMWGVGLYFGLDLAVDKSIQTIYQVEPLNAVDKNVFYDSESNRCNIMACLIFEKTTEEVLRNVF